MQREPIATISAHAPARRRPLVQLVLAGDPADPGRHRERSARSTTRPRTTATRSPRPRVKVDRFDEDRAWTLAQAPGRARPAPGGLARSRASSPRRSARALPRGRYQARAGRPAQRGRARRRAATRAAASWSARTTTRRRSPASSARTTAPAAPRRCSSSRAGSSRARSARRSSGSPSTARRRPGPDNDGDFERRGLRGSKVAARSVREGRRGDDPARLRRRQAAAHPARGATPTSSCGASCAPPPAGSAPSATSRTTRRAPISDDHIPFIRRGVPSIDLIDFDFPCWHKTCDDLSAVSRGVARRERRNGARAAR